MGPGGPPALQTPCGGAKLRWVSSILTHSRRVRAAPTSASSLSAIAQPSPRRYPPEMKITRITRHPRLDRVRIYVDDEASPQIELAYDLVLQAGLAVGDTLESQRLEKLVRDDEVCRAREAALRLLSHRARSAAELRRRLERREVPPRIVSETLAWLEERGYVDDRAFAESFVRDRLRLRPRGRAGLIQELRRRGVGEAMAVVVLDDVMASEEVDEQGLAREAARAWARRNTSLLRNLDDRERRLRARRRLYGHLARRGFDPDAVSAGIAAALGD